MLQLRKSEDRGFANHGWLKSHHTFSFANYYDPAHMGFNSLRVINEDWIDGGKGFGAHPHNDMEIITYVTQGALEHQDSMGNKAVIRPGEVQTMTAGTGIVHSEFARPGEQVHLFQIWIMPNKRGLTPGYGQKSFEKELAEQRLVLVVSNSGRDGSIAINQDADLHVARLDKGKSLQFEARAGRNLWIQMIRGRMEINGSSISEGDGMTVTDPQLLKMQTLEDSEFMLFDLKADRDSR